MKTVIVTGASKGVGEAIAKALSKEYEVIAISRNLNKMELAFEGLDNITPYQMDLVNSEDIKKFKEYIADKDIRALINNAGGGGGSDKIQNDMTDNWSYAYNINVIAPMKMSQAVMPSMLKNKIGDIIMITSICGYYPYPGGGNYTAAKRAEIAFSETLRMEMAGTGIKVSQIAPGTIDTDKDHPKEIALKSEDVAEAVRWVVSLPDNVNVDSMTIMHPYNQRHG